MVNCHFCLLFLISSKKWSSFRTPNCPVFGTAFSYQTTEHNSTIWIPDYAGIRIVTVLMIDSRFFKFAGHRRQEQGRVHRLPWIRSSPTSSTSSPSSSSDLNLKSQISATNSTSFIRFLYTILFQILSVFLLMSHGCALFSLKIFQNSSAFTTTTQETTHFEQQQHPQEGNFLKVWWTWGVAMMNAVNRIELFCFKSSVFLLNTRTKFYFVFLQWTNMIGDNFRIRGCNF